MCGKVKETGMTQVGEAKAQRKRNHFIETKKGYLAGGW